MKEDVRLIDRTALILDIFARHARTHEGQLQVELAQYEYATPRLKRMWTHLSRQKNSVGLRGPGETQLEEDRRLVERRIHELRSELRGIERRKARQVRSRQDFKPAAFIDNHAASGGEVGIVCRDQQPQQSPEEAKLKTNTTHTK